MRWTRGALAVVAAAAFLALVALGVTYAVTTQPQPTAMVPMAPTGTTGAPAPTATPQPAPAPAVPAPTSPPASAVATPAATSSGPPSSTSTTPRLRPEEDPLTSLELTVGSFNVLGASHTSGRDARPGYAGGRVRARLAAQLLDRHGADVIGFQELQVSQLAVLRRVTDLDFFPGLTRGPQGAENSIGWRRGEWRAVETRTVTIPYFDGGPRVMPVVRLQSVRTGLQAWFANFHNPAETRHFHQQQRFRTRATLIEARLAARLVTTGLPVFITGDMNERAAYFCRLTSRAPMVAAPGGSNFGGRCLAGRPRQVDWIFGSQGVQFTGYSEIDGGLVDRASDHPLITAEVRIDGEPATGGD